MIFFGKVSLTVVKIEKGRVDKRALLVLEDGTIVEGLGFGAVKKVFGEVVFNTGMVGYPEAITDPSYRGQILIQTYPLVGNYGVCPAHFESEGPKVEGYVVHELCEAPSHWSSQLTLNEWLERSGVPGIERVDTRMLTKRIRVQGTMLGILQVYEAGDEPDLEGLIEGAKRVPDPNRRDLVSEVATKEVRKYDVDSDIGVVLVDCGVKRSIVRSLTERGLNIVAVPPKTGADRVLDMDPAAVVLSNGPGDPKMCGSLIDAMGRIAETKVPVLGVCLGSQIIALSLGGDTYKLKFGHRGQNHPCIDLDDGRCYITSQNHGFAVDAESVRGTGLRVTFVNANDGTVEGVAHEEKSIFGVQFHPEASPGPKDTDYVFDRFLKAVREYAGADSSRRKR